MTHNRFKTIVERTFDSLSTNDITAALKGYGSFQTYEISSIEKIIEGGSGKPERQTFQGWRNWDTWNTVLMLRNNYPDLYNYTIFPFSRLLAKRKREGKLDVRRAMAFVAMELMPFVKRDAPSVAKKRVDLKEIVYDLAYKGEVEF